MNRMLARVLLMVCFFALFVGVVPYPSTRNVREANGYSPQIGLGSKFANTDDDDGPRNDDDDQQDDDDDDDDQNVVKANDRGRADEMTKYPESWKQVKPLQTAYKNAHRERWTTQLNPHPCNQNQPVLTARDPKQGIRIQDRPVITDRGDCPTIDQVDAGVCIRPVHKNQVACLPSMVVIGVMKGGTAELQGWLSLHPFLRRFEGLQFRHDGLRPGGEAHYFDRLRSHEEFRSSWRDYVYNGFTLDDPFDAQFVYTYEKTPSYIGMKEDNIRWMHSLIPSAKLLLTLRKPSSRAYSHFQHKCRNSEVFRVVNSTAIPEDELSETLKGAILLTPNTGHSSLSKQALVRQLRNENLDVNIEHLETLKYPCTSDDFEALLAYDYKSGTWKRQLDQNPSLGGVLRRGLYAEQIDKWLKYFKSSQLGVILTEELFADTPTTIKKIENFLGVPHFDYSPLVSTNERGFTVLKVVYSKSNGISYEKMKPSVIELLDRFYYEPNMRLGNLVGMERLEEFWGVKP